MTGDIVHPQDEFDPHELNVLILDDDPICRKVSSYAVKGLGFNTRAVATPEDFFDEYSPDKYDILLLDIHLRSPISGYDIVRKIRDEEKATKKHVIIIACSAAAEEGACIDAGFDDFIQKPMTEYKKSLSEVFVNCLHNIGLTKGRRRKSRGAGKKDAY